jgi:predicted phosphodiesterase
MSAVFSVACPNHVSGAMVVSKISQLINVTGPLLVFGGPYSNFEATKTVLDEAQRLQIPSDHVVCTGDLVAYCGSPVATIELVRKSKIHVVMGNCDEQLSVGAGDCGCGFPQGSACEQLSSAWFAHANAETGSNWLGSLPRRINLDFGGIRLAVIHGSVSAINTFVYATSPIDLKRRELGLADTDGVIGGHCGLPFTEVVDGRLWHNPGVIGMPANDGTPRVWFSLISPHLSVLKIEHRALAYNHAAAARAMQEAGLPQDYGIALATGVWPSCDMLPALEATLQGARLEAGTVEWKPIKPDRTSKTRQSKVATALLWPNILDREPGLAMQPRPTSSERLRVAK